LGFLEWTVANKVVARTSCEDGGTLPAKQGVVARATEHDLLAAAA